MSTKHAGLGTVCADAIQKAVGKVKRLLWAAAVTVGAVAAALVVLVVSWVLLWPFIDLYPPFIIAVLMGSGAVIILTADKVSSAWRIGGST
jgi:hypothetical protein